jgi:hypothetical protein
VAKKLSIEDFITRANKKHFYKYDYFLSEYKGWNSKIVIICPIHGKFYQAAFSHLRGQGCPKCGIIKYSSKRALSLKEFITRAKKKHGDKYDYSLIEHVGGKIKVKIICSIHGIFTQQASNHLSGQGCKKCGRLEANNKIRLSQEDFIEKSKCIHLDKYDYSRVNYRDLRTKVKIICPIHGRYKQQPYIHLYGSSRGCPVCRKITRIKKLSCKKNEFVNKANGVHNKKYDYSLVEYKGVFVKIKIVCPIHGEFWQIPHIHLNGSGCPACKGQSISRKLTKSHEDFVKEAKVMHKNKYDYSKALYKNSKKKIEISCPKHGSFFQTPEKHLEGQGCTRCSVEKGTFKIKDTIESFITKAEKIHGKKYDYSNVLYKNSKTKVQILCSKHGSFTQVPESHLVGRGCPSCNEPFGEKLISMYFQNNRIKYERQKKFESCKNKRCLPFDFFIPVLNTCIEYDGIIHFFPCECYGGKEGFETLKKRDEIKNRFCQENGIRLIRIPYYTRKSKIRYILNSLKSEILTKALETKSVTVS